MAGKPSAQRGRRGGSRRLPAGSPAKLRNAVVAMDAEDIAMARLQAHLRRTETIHGPDHFRATTFARTWVRLPREMLQRLRDRARRAGTSVSDIVEAALARYLKAP